MQNPYYGAPADFQTASNLRIIQPLFMKFFHLIFLFCGGLTPHDLRHNFATEILPFTDIETARVLMGHADISQTGTYIHTTEKQLSDAIRKRDKVDYDEELEKIFEAVKSSKLGIGKFKRNLKELFGL